LSSVVIKSIDRSAVTAAVERWAAEVRERHAEVRRIVWLGSWVTGRPTPGSDVDLCLILTASDKPRRDRVPDYLPLGFPVGMDLFPYTEAELADLRQTSPGWYETILSGREV
jgi:uncharacterized protein